MKFYVTAEKIQKIKRSFLNLKLFSIINVPEILEELGYTYESIDEYGSFIVNKKISSLIKSYTKSKRIRGIIYMNPNLSEDIIDNLYKELKDKDNISEIVLFDDYNIPKVQHLYPYFEEVVFFPSIKKIRIIEAKNIRDHINWDKGD